MNWIASFARNMYPVWSGMFPARQMSDTSLKPSSVKPSGLSMCIAIPALAHLSATSISSWLETSMTAMSGFTSFSTCSGVKRGSPS